MSKESFKFYFSLVETSILWRVQDNKLYQQKGIIDVSLLKLNNEMLITSKRYLTFLRLSTRRMGLSLSRVGVNATFFCLMFPCFKSCLHFFNSFKEFLDLPFVIPLRLLSLTNKGYRAMHVTELLRFMQPRQLYDSLQQQYTVSFLPHLESAKVRFCNAFELSQKAFFYKVLYYISQRTDF